MNASVLFYLLSLGLAGAASAEEVRITLELKDHRFTPAEITVPSKLL